MASVLHHTSFLTTRLAFKLRGLPFLRNVTNGHVEVEQAPFAPAIARCYQAILSIQHDFSQKLDLEVVAIVAS